MEKKWHRVDEIKPKNGEFVLVYGQIKDRDGMPLKSVIDVAWYFSDKDYFTIGDSVGELWRPIYWIGGMPELPELIWPQLKT